MLILRLQRVGRRNNQAFRLVITDSRNSTKSGKFLEILGSYDPRHKGSFVYKKERVLHWMSQGAQMSDTVHNFFVKEGVITGQKRSKVPPSKFKKAKQEPAEAIKPVTPKETEEVQKE